MSQSKKLSFIEACANTAIGYVISFASQLVIFPLVDIHIPLSTDFIISLWFLSIGLLRGYIVRRYFNR